MAAIVVLLHQGGRRPLRPTRTSTPVLEVEKEPIKAIVGRLDDTVAPGDSGHTHQAYNCLHDKTGRGILVTARTPFGPVLTDIDMQIDPSGGQVVSVTANNIVVDRANETIAPMLSSQTSSPSTTRSCRRLRTG